MRAVLGIVVGVIVGVLAQTGADVVGNIALSGARSPTCWTSEQVARGDGSPSDRGSGARCSATSSAVLAGGSPAS